MAKEYPIIFSGPMVNAILEPRKSQTRRLLKLPKWSTGDWNDLEFDNGKPMIICKKTGCLAEIPCPYGQPGDRLWVRENWSNFGDAKGVKNPDGIGFVPPAIQVYYHADKKSVWLTFDEYPEKIPPTSLKNIPSIHMYRWASRILLENTGVKVERLQDISQEDAVAEGARFQLMHYGGHEMKMWSMEEPFPDHGSKCLYTPKAAFLNFINQLHGGPNWNLWYNGNPKYKKPLSEENPLVWVISFKVLEVKGA